MMYANYFSVRGVTGARNKIVNPTSGAGIRAYGISDSQDIQASFADTVMTDTTGTLTKPFSVGAYAAVSKSTCTFNGQIC